MSNVHDPYHPSTPYTHSAGNLWHPSEPLATYESMHQYPMRHMSPSPTRRFEGENNYRPIYGSDDFDNNRRFRTRDRCNWHVPDLTSRGHLAQSWNSSALPQSTQEYSPASPTPLISRISSGSTLATRMFEPSASWKLTHSDRVGRREASWSQVEHQTCTFNSYQPLDWSPQCGVERPRPSLTHGAQQNSNRPRYPSPTRSRWGPYRTGDRFEYFGRVLGSGPMGTSVSSWSRRKSPASNVPMKVRPWHRDNQSTDRGHRSPCSLPSGSHSSTPSVSRSRSRSPRRHGRRSRSKGCLSSSLGHGSEGDSRSRSTSRPSCSEVRWDHFSANGQVNGKDSISQTAVSRRRSISRSSIASTQRSASPLFLHQTAGESAELRSTESFETSILQDGFSPTDTVENLRIPFTTSQNTECTLLRSATPSPLHKSPGLPDPINDASTSVLQRSSDCHHFASPEESSNLPISTIPRSDLFSGDNKSITESLRIVIMARNLCNRQTREELAEPILKSNLAMASWTHGAFPPPTFSEATSTPEDLFREVTKGGRTLSTLGKYGKMEGSLVDRFRARQESLIEKTQRLRNSYLFLHKRWIFHCAQLDELSKPPAAETEPVPTSGRATRRTMANLGDAVRTDLEMEQIIASLGNDDATDPNHLSLRNRANIPAMISATRGRIDWHFDETNHFIDNPVEYYGPRTGINDWTVDEKAVLLDKFAAHPKQFGVIAEHIPNKSASQCVDYYYLHKKKLINFRKVVSQYAPNKRRKGTSKKKGNGLLADIRQHDAEVHRNSGSPPPTGYYA